MSSDFIANAGSWQLLRACVNSVVRGLQTRRTCALDSRTAHATSPLIFSNYVGSRASSRVVLLRQQRYVSRSARIRRWRTYGGPKISLTEISSSSSASSLQTTDHSRPLKEVCLFQRFPTTFVAGFSSPFNAPNFLHFLPSACLWSRYNLLAILRQLLRQTGGAMVARHSHYMTCSIPLLTLN